MKAGANGRQRGAVLILFFLALFLSGATVVLSALNNRTGLLARNVEMQLDMELAKEALLSYAMMYPIEYAAGPGRLPCVDTNNDALPDCTAATLGRLPQRVALPSGVPFSLSSAGAGVDQQFWYAVSTSFRTSAATVNASTAPTTAYPARRHCGRNTTTAHRAIAASSTIAGTAEGMNRRPHHIICGELRAL